MKVRGAPYRASTPSIIIKKFKDLGEVRLELTWYLYRHILSVVRLPFRHSPKSLTIIP
jgi:hypothetical protein